MPLPLRVLVVLLVPLPVCRTWAAEPAPPPTPGSSAATNAPCGGRPTQGFDMDQAHSFLAAGVRHTAERIDRYFGGPTWESPDLVARLQVSVDAEYSYIDGFGPGGSIDGEFNLPALNKRLSLVLKRFDRDGDASELLDLQEDPQVAAGLRQKVGWGDRILAHIDLSARVQLPVVWETRLRFEQESAIGCWYAELDEYLFWYSDEGFGVTGRVKLWRELPRHVVLRMSSKATWSESTKGVSLGQSLSLGYTFAEKHTLGGQVYGVWHTAPALEGDQYGIDVRYCRCLWRNWFSLMLGPSLSFALADDYEPNPGLKVAVMVDLGK